MPAGVLLRVALTGLALATYCGWAFSQTIAEPRVRALRHLPPTHQAARQELMRGYVAVFNVLGMVRACGLDWRARYDDFIHRLDRRHGALEMDTNSIPDLIKSAMSIGAQGQWSRSASERLTCALAAERLPDLQLTAVPELLVERPGERSRPSAPGAHEDVLVLQESDFMRSVYAEKLGGDWKRVLRTQEILKIAGDIEAVAALDRHLQAIALATLARQQPPPPGTVDEVVEQQRGTGPALARLRTELLSTALAMRMDSPSPAASSPPVSILIENTSPAEMRQFDAALRLSSGADSATVELDCRAVPHTRDLRPGATARFACGNEHGRNGELAKKIRAATDAGAQWTLHARRVNFGDPPVSFHGSGGFWLDDWPAQAARLDLKAAGCSARGSCVAEVQQQLRRPDSGLFKLLVNVVLWAAITVLLAWLSPRRRLIAAGILSSLFLALWLAGLVSAWQANSLIAIVFIVFAPLYFAWNLGVLWSIVLVLHLYQRRRRHA